MVLSILDGSPEKFAVPFSFGAVLSLLSTMFLMGPCNQVKKMFEPSRIVVTCVYLSSIVVTLIVAFVSASVWLVLLCVCVQMLSLMWYALSFIPYGREAVTGCCKSVVSA
jgi:hypothetical protein